MAKGKWELIGHVGVDSGTLMVGDPCYLDDPDDWNPELYDKWICGELGNDGKSFVEINEMCFNQAVAFSSGLGDGVYPVFAKIINIGSKDNPDYRIAEVKIKML